jgi:hypothetical protein
MYAVLNQNFETLIRQYHIVLFTEATTDQFDMLNIPTDYAYHFE